MRALNLLSLGVIAASLSACQVKVGGVEEPSVAPSIVGIWSSDCMVDFSDSYIKSFEVKDGNLTMATLRYSGTNICDQANLSATIMQTGVLTEVSDSSTVTNGRNYEWQISMVVLVPNDATMTANLNSGNVCGTIWTLNQPGILFGCLAGGMFDLSQVVPGTVHHGVFAITGNATPNFMHFEMPCAIAGYEGLCPAPSDRPDTVGGTTFFRR